MAGATDLAAARWRFGAAAAAGEPGGRLRSAEASPGDDDDGAAPPPPAAAGGGLPAAGSVVWVGGGGGGGLGFSPDRAGATMPVVVPAGGNTAAVAFWTGLLTAVVCWEGVGGGGVG